MYADEGALPDTGAGAEGVGDGGGSHAADLDVGRESDAEVASLFAGGGLFGAEVVVSDQFERPIHTGLVVAAVVYDGRGDLVSVLEGGYEVLAPDLGGVHANLGGVAVNHALDEVGGFGASRAPVGVHGRCGGEDAGHFAQHVVYAVGAHEHESEQVGGDGGREGGEVGAHVGEYVGFESGYVAFGVADYLDVADVVASVRGGEEVFLPALYPLDWPAEVLGNHAGDDLFGVEVELAAEAAAHVGGYDSYLVFGMPGHQGEEQPDEVGYLGGGIDGELVGSGVEVGDDAARLHGIGYESLVDDALGDADLGGFDGGVNVSAADFPFEGDVVGGVLVYLGGAVLDGLFHVHHGVQNVVVHLDQLRGVSGGLRAVGYDRRHDVSDAVHLVYGDGRVGDFLGVGDDPAANKGAELFVEVGAGIYAHHAFDVGRGGCVNSADVGVGVRAADERHVQHSEQADVVNVLTLAGNQPGVFTAFHASTDYGLRSHGLSS